jgi:hypothetical protein
MSKQIARLLPALLAASLGVAAMPATVSAASTPAKIQVQHARFGGGFRSYRRPSFGSRYRSRPYGRYRYYHRPSIFRGILRAIGIAFLLHALFGWGAGGSPLGLLLLVAFFAWLVTRRRRRPVPYGW